MVVYLYVPVNTFVCLRFLMQAHECGADSVCVLLFTHVSTAEIKPHPSPKTAGHIPYFGHCHVTVSPFP